MKASIAMRWRTNVSSEIWRCAPVANTAIRSEHDDIDRHIGRDCGDRVRGDEGIDRHAMAHQCLERDMAVRTRREHRYQIGTRRYRSPYRPRLRRPRARR